MSGKGNIRIALPEDAAAIAQIQVTAWRHAYRDIMSAERLAKLDVAERTQLWQQILAQETSTCFVVDSAEGELTGFLDTCPCRDEDRPSNGYAEITAMYILPDRWRRGLGSKLITTAIHTLETQGYQGVTLWVLRDNLRACRFYHAHGFEPDGTEEVHPASGLVEVRYQRMLKQDSHDNAQP